MVKAVDKEESLQQWATTQDEIVYPSLEAALLPYLLVYHNRLQCLECLYINCSIKQI
jgi:hypothetical protein